MGKSMIRKNQSRPVRKQKQKLPVNLVFMGSFVFLVDGLVDGFRNINKINGFGRQLSSEPPIKGVDNFRNRQIISS
jgi:hypothetical protein